MKQAIFKVEHLYKRYGTSKEYTLKDCNLEVYGGSIFGFLGPNGAGKSTLIKSAIGLSKYDKGKVSLCGKDSVIDRLEYKKILGFVPDQYVLYEKSTGYEFLLSIGKFYKVPKDKLINRINTIAKRLNVTSFLDRKISSYSHGTKQKIAIIASLLHEPKLWILDEPLTGLDPITVMQVKNMMKEYAKKGNIVFFSSHLIDIVKNLCTDIAIIVDGEIKTVKKISRINKDSEALEKYYISVTRSKE